MGKIIAAMDTPAGGDIEVIPLRNAVAVRHRADGAAPDRRRRHRRAGVPGARRTSARRRRRSWSTTRSNSLIVRAPNPTQAWQRALSSIAKLDRAAAGRGRGRQHLGRLPEERRRREDAPVLRAAFGRRLRQRRRRRRPAAAAAPTPARPRQPPRRRRRHRRNAGTAAARGADHARRPGPSTGGFIQADPATNSLIITAPEPLYRQMRAMIDQLDVRRAQVYIESLIVEVDRRQGGRVRLPVAGRARRQAATRTSSSAAPTSAPPATCSTASGAAGAGARHHHGTAPPRSSRSAQGLQHRPGAQVLRHLRRWRRSPTSCRSRPTPTSLSTPNLVTLDNEEAKIVVGRTCRSSPASSPTPAARCTQPVPDDRAQGRRHHAAHQAADRRERHRCA